MKTAFFMSYSQLSKEYFENLEYYKKMHTEGYKLSNGKTRIPEEAYNGKSTLIFAKLIKEIITKNKINTMLDYGCGKGFFYKNPSNQNGLEITSLKNYWGIDIDLYDPYYFSIFEGAINFDKLKKKSEESFKQFYEYDFLEHQAATADFNKNPGCCVPVIRKSFLDQSKKIIFIVTGKNKCIPVENWKSEKPIPASQIISNYPIDIYCNFN